MQLLDITELSTISWSLAAALVSTTYFFLIKYYIKNKDTPLLLAIIGLELLVIYLYYKSLEGTRSGIIYAVINAFSVIMGALIAVFLFGEKLSLQDIIGISVIVIGIMMVGKK